MNAGKQERPMKAPLQAGLALIFGLGFVGVAQGADLSDRFYKAPAATGTWTGFYAGLGVGERWSNSDWTTTAAFTPAGGAFPFATDTGARFSSTNFRASGYAGYNWQLAQTWVVGLEADFGWANNRDSIGLIPGLVNLSGGTSVEVKASWDASLRARAGYLITPQWLAYATGGVAVQHLEAIATCPADAAVCNPAAGTQSASNSTDRVGWTIGGGLETKFASNWLARIEYRYSDYGRYSFTALPFSVNNFGANASLSTRTQLVTVGLAYKFGSY
jgi:outer membrane immunogenic protein